MDNKNLYNELYFVSLSFVIAKAVGLFAELNLEKFLQNGPVAIKQLADDMQVHPDALFRFLRVLAAYKIVDFLEDGLVVTATPLTSYLSHINSPHITDGYELFTGATHSLKTNQNAWEHVFNKTFYQSPSSSPEKTAAFQKWNTLTAQDWLPPVLDTYDFSKAKKVVDVGGGAGYFLNALLTRYPNLLGILYDQEAAIAQSIFNESHKCSSRVEKRSGNFFINIPTGGDVYSICRTLLNWSDEDAIKILENCYQAMQSKGKLVIVDFFVPASGHPKYTRAVVNDLYLFVGVNSAIRTEKQWRDLTEKASFTLTNFLVCEDTPSSQPFLPLCVIELMPKPKKTVC